MIRITRLEGKLSANHYKLWATRVAQSLSGASVKTKLIVVFTTVMWVLMIKITTQMRKLIQF